MIGTAGTTACTSPTCGCHDCLSYTGTDRFTQGGSSHEYYVTSTTATGSDLYFYDDFPLDEDLPEALNLFDQRYRDDRLAVRIKPAPRVIEHRNVRTKVLFSKSWVARSRSNKPLRRRIRKWERDV